MQGDMAVRTQSYLSGDQSWMGSAAWVEKGEPIELDLSLFDFVTNFPNGFLPSGIVLARVTSSGKYGHYDPGTTEVQSVIATGGTTGDFTFGFEGETTAPIAYNASAADVQAALLALDVFDPGDVVASGGPLPGTAVTITFGGKFAGQDVPALVVVDNITNGTATVTTGTAGGTGAATGGAGLEIARGHLAFPKSVSDGVGGVLTSGAVGAALFTRGRVRVGKLPAHHNLDSAARAALPHIEYLGVHGDAF